MANQIAHRLRLIRFANPARGSTAITSASRQSQGSAREPSNVLLKSRLRRRLGGQRDRGTTPSAKNSADAVLHSGLPGARTGMGISVLDLPMPRVSPGLGALLRSIATRTPQLSCARAHFPQDGPHSRIAETGFADGQQQDHRDTATRGNRSRAAKRAV